MFLGGLYGRIIVNSYQNYPALVRLAVLFILSAAHRLVYFWSELTISLQTTNEAKGIRYE